ncbi:DUF6597 domain-containing transcriptional factor [Paenibacillus sp. GCM10023250]|uniref:DUF6597 domain-containing transcriptional factor n=1 Tax=Paenibacillus sp. GCM10023250 TaxID=3252648 RepID=UPI003605FFF6
MEAYRPLQPPMLQIGLTDADYRYREYEPCEALRPYVACYWTVDVRAPVGSGRHRVIPDGCVDIMLELGRLPRGGLGAFAAGLMTGFDTPELGAERSVFGIRFYAETAARFLRHPVAGLASDPVPLDALWGGEAALLLEEARGARGIADVIGRVQRRLTALPQRAALETDTLIRSGLRLMHASRGCLAASDLAAHYHWSERNVRRIFKRELGVGPKKLLGILRFQYALQALRRGIPAKRVEAALTHGYYDESHFAADFRRLYGLPPRLVFDGQSRPFSTSGLGAEAR